MCDRIGERRRDMLVIKRGKNNVFQLACDMCEAELELEPCDVVISEEGIFFAACPECDHRIYFDNKAPSEGFRRQVCELNLDVRSMHPELFGDKS